MQTMSFNVNNFGGAFPPAFCQTKAADCRIGNDHGPKWLAGYQATYVSAQTHTFLLPFVAALLLCGDCETLVLPSWPPNQSLRTLFSGLLLCDVSPI